MIRSMPTTSAMPTAIDYAMPPNAPMGAAHMIRRMTPKMIRERTSKTEPTTLSRSRSGRPETAIAVRIASTSTWRIALSTNGSAMLVGSRSSVMNATTPWSPASPIDSLASACCSDVGLASKPSPGLTRLPAASPSASATTVAQKK
jgi:hypothetical protein